MASTNVAFSVSPSEAACQLVPYMRGLQFSTVHCAARHMHASHLPPCAIGAFCCVAQQVCEGASAQQFKPCAVVTHLHCLLLVDAYDGQQCQDALLSCLLVEQYGFGVVGLQHLKHCAALRLRVSGRKCPNRTDGSVDCKSVACGALKLGRITLPVNLLNKRD